MTLEGFLAANERRALRFAQLATNGDADEALDLVQEAMIALARHYANKPAAEWPALFHRILDNRIRRWRFKQLITRRWLGLRATAKPDAESEDDPLAQLPASEASAPDAALLGGQTLAAVQQALKRLPDRQRQAFLLRHWQELSTEETATAMGCSTGSVKTHLSRAVASLKEQLQLQGVSP